MSISLASPVTGAAETGFTAPTYTVGADTAPPGNPGKQYAVSALGGTQAGVTVHSVSSPFTVNFTRPSNLRTLPAPNPVTGIVANVPFNEYKVITRKGVTVLTGQPIQVMTMITVTRVPAGADVADLPNVKACQSLHAGALWAQSAGFGDLTGTGTL